MIPLPSIDACLKCNICTAACPVAAVSEAFPGPKAVGPQAQRFRHPRLKLSESSIALCSGCGVCSRVCPHNVAVADINILAKARHARRSGVPLRDHIISRPATLARLARPFAGLANLSLRLGPIRRLLELLLGVASEAPLPPFAARTLRSQLADRCVTADRIPGLPADTIAYFHGCSSQHYEPHIGMMTVHLLERLGFNVVLPPQTCCGLPLQSNGLLDAARRYARKNARTLAPFIEAGIPIVGTSTSCTLALKHDYRSILDLRSETFDSLAESTFDLFEFLLWRASDRLQGLEYGALSARALYHPPCQLRLHGIGTPALQVLQHIRGLELVISEHECCGIAGTYGLKRERYDTALQVGSPLFQQAQAAEVDFLITDSETCRWWLSAQTGLPAYHPIEVMAMAVGLRASYSTGNTP